jgi:hypothetical protein
MWRAKRLSLIGVVASALAAGAGGTAAAGGGFDDAAVGPDELAQQRAGDFDVASSIASSQNQAAEQSGNTVNGDVADGDVNIAAGAMDSLQGMGLIVANSATLGIAQGQITLNVILNPPPASP